MGDMVAFIGTIFALFTGGGEIIAQVIEAAETWTALQWRKTERKLIPSLARTSRNALVATTIIILIAFYASIRLLYKENPVLGFIAEYPSTASFLVIAIGAMVIRWFDLGSAIARALAEMEPDTLGEGEDEVQNPFAGQHMINEQAFRPERLKPATTITVISIALLVLAIGLGYAACQHKNQIVMIVAVSLWFLVLEVHHQIVRIGAWSLSKGTLVGAFAANIGLLQASPFLYGVTRENARQLVNLQGISTANALEWTDRRFGDLFAFLAVPAAILISLPRPITAYTTLIIYGVIVYSGIANAHFNPLDEHSLHARFARLFRRAIVAIAIFLLIWQLIFSTATKEKLARSFAGVWSLLLGDACLPVEGNWKMFAAFLALTVGAIWLFKKYASDPPLWVKRVFWGILGVCGLIAFWLGLQLAVTYGGKTEICSPLSSRPAQKVTRAPEKKTPLPEDDTSGWQPMNTPTIVPAPNSGQTMRQPQTRGHRKTTAPTYNPEAVDGFAEAYRRRSM